MLKKTLLILLPILLLFCFAGTAAADGVDGEVESFDYDSGAASADSGAVSLEGSETSSADAVVSSEPAVTEEALPAETEMPAENIGAAESGSTADEQGNESENTPAADSEPLEGGAPDPEGPAEQADVLLEEDLQQNSCDEGEESPLLIDPYFYDSRGGKNEFFGVNGIQQAIDEFSIYDGRGLIYVEYGVFNGFVIDAVPNLTGIVFKDFYPREADEPFNPYDSARWPIIDGNVSISNMPSGFTLLGLVINGSVTFTGCKGQLNLNYLEVEGPGYGINIQNHAGNVVISNVEVINNTGSGAYGAQIDNSNGGNITITNSAFNNNASYGIDIKTNGIVTVNGIDASDNSSYGMKVYGFSRLTLSNAVFTRNSSGTGLLLDTTKAALVTIRNIYSSSNKGDGIGVYTEGVVTVSDVTALNNTIDGMRIVNRFGNPSAVNITRGIFWNNFVGISVLSNGAVTLIDVSAWNNFCGVYIDNTYGTANVTIRSSRAGTAYNFSNNEDCGIYIASKGVVTVSDVTANNNQEHGVFIENHNASAARNVILTRVSVSGNTLDPWSRDGIYIRSRGNVLLTDVSSSNNQNSSGDYHGLYIDNRGVQIEGVWTGAGTVTIRSSRAGTAYDFSNNQGSGIYILSNGVVSVSDVTSNNNLRYGILIGNNTAPAARNVTLTRVSVSGNTVAPWSHDGIYILSRGNVLLTDVSSSNNQNSSDDYHGLYIDNRGVQIEGVWTGAGSVTIRSSRAGTTYDFSNNGGGGIYIRSNGVVTLSDVAADGNGTRGIDIRNNLAPTARNVTLTRCSADNNLSDRGISIRSKGAVTLIDASASHNGKDPEYDHGLAIRNHYGTANVTIRSSRAGTTYDFSNNRGKGIYIESNGVVTLSDVAADGNGTRGIDIEYHNAPIARNVTLTRCSADSNDETGISIYSKGAVTLTDVSASGNGTNATHHGVHIENADGTGNVTVRSSRATHYNNMSGNKGTGLQILSKGVVTVINVNAYDNDTKGININNYDSVSAPRAVNLTRCNAVNNGNRGVEVVSKGAVTLVDVSATYNNGHGVFIDNKGEGAAGNVTVRSSKAASYCDFSNNYGAGANGLDIHTNGSATVRNINASSNSNNGIYVRTYVDNRNIVFQNINTSGNGGHGVSASGQDITNEYITVNVTATGVRSYNNIYSGIALSGDTGRLNFSNCAFMGNGFYGIWNINMDNPIVTLRNTLAAGNGNKNILF